MELGFTVVSAKDKRPKDLTQEPAQEPMRPTGEIRRNPDTDSKKIRHLQTKSATPGMAKTAGEWDYGPLAPGRNAETRWEGVISTPHPDAYEVIVLWPGDEAGMLSLVTKDGDRALAWADLCWAAGATNVSILLGGRSVINHQRTAGKYRAEVAGNGESKWSTNSLEFETPEEAQAWLDGLKMRWFGYDMGRVVTVETPKGEAVSMEGDIYQNFRSGSRTATQMISSESEKMCDQKCGRKATGYWGGPRSGDWAGHYCEECGTALKFQKWDDYAKKAGSYSLAPTDGNTRMDLEILDPYQAPDIIRHPGHFIVMTRGTKERYYARPTGRTTKKWGLSCPTFEVYRVETVVREATPGEGFAIWGDLGARVPGIWLANPSAAADITRSTASKTADIDVDPLHYATCANCGGQLQSVVPNADRRALTWTHVNASPTCSGAVPKAGQWMGAKTAGTMFPGPGAHVYYNDAGEPLGWDEGGDSEPDESDAYDREDAYYDEVGEESDDGYSTGQETFEAHGYPVEWDAREGWTFEGEPVSEVWAEGFIEGWDQAGGPPVKKGAALRPTQDQSAITRRAHEFLGANTNG